MDNISALSSSMAVARGRDGPGPQASGFVDFIQALLGQSPEASADSDLNTQMQTLMWTPPRADNLAAVSTNFIDMDVESVVVPSVANGQEDLLQLLALLLGEEENDDFCCSLERYIANQPDIQTLIGKLQECSDAEKTDTLLDLISLLPQIAQKDNQETMPPELAPLTALLMPPASVVEVPEEPVAKAETLEAANTVRVQSDTATPILETPPQNRTDNAVQTLQSPAVVPEMPQTVETVPVAEAKTTGPVPQTVPAVEMPPVAQTAPTAQTVPAAEAMPVTQTVAAEQAPPATERAPMPQTAQVIQATAAQTAATQTAAQDETPAAPEMPELESPVRAEIRKPSPRVLYTNPFAAMRAARLTQAAPAAPAETVSINAASVEGKTPVVWDLTQTAAPEEAADLPDVKPIAAQTLSAEDAEIVEPQVLKTAQPVQNQKDTAKSTLLETPAATASSAAQPTAPVEASQAQAPEEIPARQMLAEKIIDQITAKAAQTRETTVLQMELNPKFLGKVHLVLEATADGMTARLKSDNDAVRSLLSQSITELRDALKDAGINMRDIEITETRVRADLSGRQQDQPQQPWQSQTMQNKAIKIPTLTAQAGAEWIETAAPLSTTGRVSGGETQFDYRA